jgi:hypothetical protein
MKGRPIVIDSADFAAAVGLNGRPTTAMRLPQQHEMPPPAGRSSPAGLKRHDGQSSSRRQLTIAAVAAEGGCRARDTSDPRAGWPSNVKGLSATRPSSLMSRPDLRCDHVRR